MMDVRAVLSAHHNHLILQFSLSYFRLSLKGLCHPTRMREPMKTNLKKLARLFQVLSEILEGCFQRVH